MKNKIILNENQYVRDILVNISSNKVEEIVKPDIGFFKFLLWVTKYYSDKELDYALYHIEDLVKML